MPYPYTLLITEVTGNVLSASDYNNEHQNHINNNIPGSIGGDSANVSGMQATVDPYPASAESLATDLKGELERMRFVLKSIKGSGVAQWYIPHTTDLTTITTGISGYRRPRLSYSSGSVVDVEQSLDGTSGDCKIMFPDGTIRNETSATLRQCTLSQNAVLTGTKKGGIFSGSVTSNTWYSFYAVKATDNTTDWVHVAISLLPIQANYATLNSNFGTSGWVYLGTLPYGDNSGAGSAIPVFTMSGSRTKFDNALTLSSVGGPGRGVRLATTAGALNLVYTATTGMTLSSNQYPSIFTHGIYGYACDGQGSAFGLLVENAGATFIYAQFGGNSSVDFVGQVDAILGDGLKVQRNTGTPKIDIFLVSYDDPILAAGSGALL